jgi:Xaa-Pro aminopeptidase
VVTADRSRATLAVLLLAAMACSAAPSPQGRPSAAPVAPVAVAAPVAPVAPAAVAVVARPAAPPAAATPRGADVYEQPVGDLREECARRRRELAAKVGGPSVVWVETPSGPELERFFQEDNFYYLSGVELPDVALALRIDAQGQLVDEVLFLPAHDRNFEVWNGARLAPGAEAEAATGFRRTLEVGGRAALLAEWAPETLHVLPAGGHGEDEGTRLSVEVPPGTAVLSDGLPSRLAELRLVKSPYELDCLQAAIDITCAALREAFRQVRPGAFEYEPQGALEGAFLRLGAERPGFASICGSGPNSVTLHYNSNRRQMQGGELLVMDVGAKYRYYCADVTRTVPVSGRFTPRQREVYELVLAAQTAAFEAARPGVTMNELDGIARRVIEEGGFGPARTYFKHGLGHWIGLDVHDVGGRAPIEPGMTFTIEPGIYIDEEALGVRIEDDYLMTPEGAVKLSDTVPSDPDDIESLLSR